MKSAGLTRFAPYLLSVLRIVAACLFIAHGTQKLFGFPSVGGSRTVAVTSLLGAAGVLEAFGGLLMALGLFTRPVALVLCGEMAYAYFTQHAPRGAWQLLNGGELAVLYCFLWLFIIAAGPGPLSLDATLRHRG
jgi:putative oxidoreductase